MAEESLVKCMSRLLNDNQGFSLIELTIAIIIIGVLVGVVLQSMTSVVGDARRIKTERELEQLAIAIVGDANLTQGGGRNDFGYVGDIGSFPPNLSALYNNPGGYSTWDGPYILSGFTQDSTGLKTDEWGAAYNYSGGVTITSTGSGSTITKKIARSTQDYLLNVINGTIKDGADSLPGVTFRDSVDIAITIPNGSGGTQTKSYNPDSAGIFVLDSIPVGTHPLRIIYTPAVDTMFRYLTVYPRHKSGPYNYKFASNYFEDTTSGGIEYVDGTIGFVDPDCERVTFDITNTSGSDITLTDMTVSWSTPTAWYDRIVFDGITIWSENSPSNGTGDVASFISSQVVTPSQTITVIIRKFKDQNDGGGGDVDMNNVTFTILFSDGSTFDVTTGACP